MDSPLLVFAQLSTGGRSTVSVSDEVLQLNTLYA
jgi:hypothetical protein